MLWKKNSNRTIWVVGASSGIGLALVNALLEQGHAVIASARRDSSLLPLYSQYPDRFRYVRCDATSDESVKEAILKITENVQQIDTLIYNAGICEYIEEAQLNTESFKRVFDTNVFGFTRIMEHGASLLKPHQGAQLAVVSSSAAYLPLPRAEAYGASKAAVSYLLHCMRLTLADQGIHCSVISPGFVKTPLTDKNDFPMPMIVTEAQAAEAIINGLKKGSFDIHFPKRFTYLLKLLGSLPAFARHWIAKWMVRA